MLVSQINSKIAIYELTFIFTRSYSFGNKKVFLKKYVNCVQNREEIFGNSSKTYTKITMKNLLKNQLQYFPSLPKQ